METQISNIFPFI